MKVFILFILSFYVITESFGQVIELEPIAIEKNFIAKSTQGKDYIYPDKAIAFSLEENLDYSSSIDLRKRGAFGLQQDVSLRGSVFEDTTISLGGVKINDPQTGHYNLEIPLTSADLKQIEIQKNSQKVEYVLKTPKAKGTLLVASFGQHALWEELLSTNFAFGGVDSRLSIEHKESNGAPGDRDFEIYNMSLHSLWQSDPLELEFLFGSTKRDFGAANFYSVSFPHQEEHTNQRFYSLRGGLNKDYFDFNSTAYFRRHSDKFILDRHNPPFFTNQHKTYIYGLINEIEFDNDLFFNFDIAREKIKSTNLNRHCRLRKGFSLGVKEKRLNNFVFDIEAGLDYYEIWEYLENSHLGLGYFFDDKAKLRFSFDRIWRAPSFTELYYVSASNLGNSTLGIQKSNNYEIGLDYTFNKNIDLSISGYLRDQKDTIDWVKDLSADPWQAQNIGDLQAYGFDFYSGITFKEKAIDKVSFAYTYLELSKDNPYNLSKYVFDYSRHKLVSDFGFNLAGLSINTTINFIKPDQRKEYTTLDLKIAKEINDFTLALTGINVFNNIYQELDDIRASGRWYKLSLTYQF